MTEDGDAVYYVSRRKRLADSTVSFADVDRVQTGQHTSVFARLKGGPSAAAAAAAAAAASGSSGGAATAGGPYGQLEPLSLSIVCAGGRTLDFAFDTREQMETW